MCSVNVFSEVLLVFGATAWQCLFLCILPLLGYLWIKKPGMYLAVVMALILALVWGESVFVVLQCLCALFGGVLAVLFRFWALRSYYPRSMREDPFY